MSTERKLAVTFACAYQSMHEATQDGREDSRIVWQDIFVDTADKLGLQDDDMHGLKDARDEKRRRDDDWMANYRAERDARRTA